MATLRELMEIYPDALPEAKRAAKAKLKLAKTNLRTLYIYREAWIRDINKMHFKAQPEMIAWLDGKVSAYTDAYEREIKKAQYDLTFLESIRTGKPMTQPKDGVTDEMIERAKAYPISELLEVKRKQAHCPFHDDTTPSMHIYADNHAFCFVCPRRADAIDIYMQLNSCDFKTAVRFLAL